ncbi:MAG TPA: sialidase family protein [Polyangiaceae bacterium]|jgi:MYXO-CTERM domain-containing protein
MTHFQTRIARIGSKPRSRSCASRFAACALCFTLVLGASHARANGRFPNAEQLREVAPGQVVVSGTYGLLVSGNSTDFEFVCESALFGKSLMGSWVDPLLETLPDGTILSGSLNGLRLSRDRGCSFQSDWSLPHDPAFIPPDPSATGKTGTVVDLCPAYDSTHGAIALTTITNSDGSTLEHQLYHTTDNAKTWSALGVPIPTSMVRVVLTVDVAPSDPTHIYVSGNFTGKNILVVSEDSGATWTPHELMVDDSADVGGLYIAAISPTDPKRVYMRVNRQSQADDGSTTWDDSLLVTDDEGMTSRDVLREQAALLAFALSPDGTTVLAGFGDPVVAPIVVDSDVVGLYSASSDALTFTQKIPNFYPSCLRWTSDALYACAKESDPLGLTAGETDFHVGVYQGAGVPSALSDFTVLTKLKDVRGPLPLASGMPSSCETEWTTADPSSPGVGSVCATLNACPGDAGTVTLSAGAIICGETSDAGTSVSGSSSGGQSALGGSGGQSATGGSKNPSAGAGVGAGGTGAGASSGAKGCSCAAGEAPQNGAFFGLFLGLGFALWRRVRRAE